MAAANYTTDLGNFIGVYTMKMSNPNLMDNLPQRILEQFLLIPNRKTTGCRSAALKPRYAQLSFSNNTTSFIELPITPTIDELKELRINSGALIVELFGERIFWSKLQYLKNGS